MSRTDAPARYRVVDRIRAARARLRRTPAGRLGLKIGTGVVGTAIVLIGVLLLPLPGPGWLIIFAGLGLMATEFEWAARLLRWARARVSEWTAWVGRQGRPVQVLLGLAALVVVAAVVTAAWRFYTR